MRVITRIAAAASSALAMLTLIAGTALAGDWAEVTVAPDAGGPPVAGEDHQLRLTLLQHGMTPVDWGDVNLTGTNPVTGETITVEARSAGGGEWVADVMFPTDGTWQLTVAHSDLETSAVPSLSVERTAVLTWLPTAALVAAGAGAAGIGAFAVARSMRRARPSTDARVATGAEG
jgi:hypothetical protein